MVEIQIFEDQVAKTMNSNPLDPLRLVDATERLSLLQLLNRQLDQLEMTLVSDFQNPMDDFRRLSMLAARLHLLTYTFLDTDRIAKFELNRGKLRAYNAALSLIAHCKEAQERDKYFVRHLPGIYVLTIWQASCIIVKLVHSDDASYLDVGAGRQLYQDAMNLVYKASITKHDMAYRSAAIMKSAWSLFKTLHSQNAMPSKGKVWYDQASTKEEGAATG
ncbi:unnamed protein product [Ambrosiozyma monospora]|uniref:Unnamed protein product n=1 Tax=Ambrosiozyma monospora TaxID=43982 RepID=A0A9W6WM35_AMBMO|nr:unnamed protein product [Ambrosiozyma monospora]